MVIIKHYSGSAMLRAVVIVATSNTAPELGKEEMNASEESNKTFLLQERCFCCCCFVFFFPHFSKPLFIPTLDLLLFRIIFIHLFGQRLLYLRLSSISVAEDDFKLLTLLPLISKRWDSRCVPLCLIYVVLTIKHTTSWMLGKQCANWTLCLSSFKKWFCSNGDWTEDPEDARQVL